MKLADLPVLSILGHGDVKYLDYCYKPAPSKGGDDKH